MPLLARRGKEEWSGRVFAGVGTGIAFAGLFGLAAGIEAWVRARAGSRSA